MTTTETVEAGREAFARQAWRDAADALTAVDRRAPLDAADLERLAVAAYLTGRDAASHAAFERAHLRFRDTGDERGAIRCAFWLGMLLHRVGEAALATGWMARARRLAKACPDCAEAGYVLIPEALRALGTGDDATAEAMFRRVAERGDDHGDPDLSALGRLGLGQTHIRTGATSRGLVLLDEVMVSVTAGEVSPIPAGIIYCAVIESCHDAFDLRRAQEWTAALTAWCDRQPDLVPYRGQCLVHRSEILQSQGDWVAALDAARDACDRLSVPPGNPALAAALYQQAEVHRLRGEFDEAEDAYRRASRLGHSPQPGLATLRLAQDRPDLAAASVGRALEETHDPAGRARLLAVAVEVHLALRDIAAARTAADDLAAVAATLAAPPVSALAARSAGLVTLAEGDPSRAIDELRRALAVWRDLDVPYEIARVRVLIGQACAELRDADGADLEFDAARRTFTDLGAAPDLARLERLAAASGEPADEPPAGLTDREVEVLRHVARGRTNRDIAAALVISEHTVARHVQNILAKLDVASRTAAAAFAYDHGLVDRHGES